MLYINPLELLEESLDTTVDSNLKDLNKLKKMLLAEIELSENGGLIHNNQLISKSDCLDILDSLDDNNLVTYYSFLKENSLLHRFLSVGDIELFSNFEIESIYKSPDFINFILPYFGYQYNNIFLEKFKNNDIISIKILLKQNILLEQSCQEYLYRSTVEYLGTIINYIREVLSEIKPSNEKYNEKNIHQIEEELKKCVDIEILNLLPNYFKEKKNTLATSLRNVSANVFNIFNNSQLSLNILSHAMNIDIDEYTKEKLEDDYIKIHEINRKRVILNQHKEDLDEITGILIKINELYEKAEKYLITTSKLVSELEEYDFVKYNELPEAFNEIRNRIAYELSGLSILIWNKYLDYTTSYKIIYLASNIKVDEETSKHIKSDINQLKDIKKRNTIKLLIKDMPLELDSEKIQYQSTSIPINQIDAVKWGVLIRRTNGIETSSNYTIWIHGSNKTIEIECNAWKFFERYKKPTTAIDRYRKILKQCYQSIVPSLVMNIKAKLCQGRSISIGSCKLLKDHIEIDKGFFRKKIVQLPWEYVKFDVYQGGLDVFSSDPNIKFAIPLNLREDWNAVIFDAIKDVMTGEI